MELELKDRVAVIAGGGRGIGKACAEALAAEGVRVAVLSRNASEVEATAREIQAAGGHAVGLECDLTDGAAMNGALERVRAELGAIEILVLSASAHYRPQKLHTLDDATMHDLLAIDVIAATKLCKSVVGEMMLGGYGRIIALGSLGARAGIAGASLYVGGKAYLEGLIRGIAVDYSRRGVTANVCAIGFVDTERVRSRLEGDPDARERLERNTAMRRLAAPKEIADVVTFLASARASFITGAVVDVTGGAHLNNLW